MQTTERESTAMTESGDGRLSSMSWVRGHWVPLAVLSAVITGLVVFTVIAFGGSKNPPSNSGSPVGSKAASAQAATTVTKGSKWLAGAGEGLLNAVNVDLGQVMAAEHVGHNAAAKAAGARLAADAGAALRGPMPPVETATYRSALKQLQTAGASVADGKLGPRTTRLLIAGQAGIMRVTAAADMPVPAATPAIPQPGGQ
jgi:hypothetical protein